MRAGLKSAATTSGEPCVMINGAPQMLKWFADSSNIPPVVYIYIYIHS